MSEPKPKLPSQPSDTLKRLNPHLWPSAALRAATLPASVAVAPKPRQGKPRGRKGMNDTERAYSLILEARKQAREILRWEREGITLRWPDGMTFTGDFSIWVPQGKLTIAEVKGPFIREDALIKFRAARAFWPEFMFELHQLKSGTWSRLL